MGAPPAREARMTAAGRGALLLLAGLSLLFPAVPATAGGFSRMAAPTGDVRFQFLGDPAEVSRTADGTLLVRDHIHPEGPVGPYATLPAATTWIAMPPGASGSVEAAIVESVPLAWPAGSSALERDRWLAALQPEGWSAAPACWMSNQWGMPVSFCPVIPDGRGGLLYVQRAVLSVRYAVPAGLRLHARAATGRDPFEGTYEQTFLNYEEAKSWRRADEAPLAGGRRALPQAHDSLESSPNPWIKVFVSRRGIYEITGKDLQDLNPAFAGADTASLRLFAAPFFGLSPDSSLDHAPSWMQEIPISIISAAGGNGNGLLGTQDRIRFLGQGPDGWYEDYGRPPAAHERYYQDLYNNESVYWLTWGGHFQSGSPRRIPTVTGDAFSDSSFVPQVLDRTHFRQNLIWDPRPRNLSQLNDPNQPTWERFWWLDLFAEPKDQGKQLQIDLPDAVVDRPVRVRARFWGNSYQIPNRPWPSHALRLLLNDNLVIQTDRQPDAHHTHWDFFDSRDVDTTGVWLGPGQQNFRFILPTHPISDFPPDSANVNRFDHVYLAWIEMDYTHRLIAHGDSLAFSAGGLSGTFNLEASGFSSGDVLVLDGTYDAPRWIRPKVTTADGTDFRARFRMTFDPDQPASVLLRSSANLLKPRLERFTPPLQFLRSRRDAVSMIIITHASFTEAADSLADFRRTHFPGLAAGQTASVSVVDVQEIMDEFGFGRLDPVAIRNFLQFAKRSWTGGGGPDRAPAYVLLLGDTNYDFRNFLGKGAKIFVPTYEGYYDSGLTSSIYSPQFGSDDFYGYLDGPGDVALDLYIGRMPAGTVDDAAATVNKTMRFEAPTNVGSWRGRVTLVADDICQGRNPDALQFDHMVQTEDLPPRLPTTLQEDKIYLYEYGAECIYDTKPLAAAALLERMNEGTLLVNFTGHGSDQQLADERVFEITSVPSLVNQNRLFIFFTASCSVGKYDFFGQGLGEAMLLHAGGGAISVFSASAIAYSGGNAEMNRNFLSAAFPDRDAGRALPVGQAAATAKANLSHPTELNSRRYALLGDPAVRIASPQLHVDLSLHNAATGAAVGDTLHCGLLTDVTGQVEDESGQLVAGFNGTASVRIYDSGIVRRPPNPDSLSYVLQGAPIYRGDATVSGGTFSLRFQVPSALRRGTPQVPISKAQIFAYVSSADNDGCGSLDSLSVPATEAVPSDDRQGPEISLKFDSDPSSLPPGAGFTATFHDESGINITSLVNSRSVIMEVDENGSQVHAEDVASRISFGSDFTSARLDYFVPTSLASGHSYDLVLRASDNVNNSSRIDVPFVIGASGPLSLGGVFNLPNPTRGGTRFFGQLSENAEVDVQLFTLSGRRIWRLGQPVRLTPTEFAQDGIEWDGRDSDGDRLANGVYLYKISAVPERGGSARNYIGKMVVAR